MTESTYKCAFNRIHVLLYIIKDGKKIKYALIAKDKSYIYRNLKLKHINYYTFKALLISYS